MSAHTPGPWYADIYGNLLAHGGTTCVASTWTTADKNYPEGRPYKANAKLIAAAPDLLEACKEALLEAADDCHSEGDPNDPEMKTVKAFLYRTLKAAIAKAEGK